MSVEYKDYFALRNKGELCQTYTHMLHRRDTLTGYVGTPYPVLFMIEQDNGHAHSIVGKKFSTGQFSQT